MVKLQSRLTRKNEEVVAKVMDGEAIIINLATGVYYSLDSAGGAIWEMIEAGWRMEDIATAIVDGYDVVPERARADIVQLANDLVREDIVAVDIADDVSPARASAPLAHKQAYRSPALHAYRDMEALLALDPPSPRLSDIPWKA